MEGLEGKYAVTTTGMSVAVTTDIHCTSPCNHEEADTKIKSSFSYTMYRVPLQVVDKHHYLEYL